MRRQHIELGMRFYDERHGRYITPDGVGANPKCYSCIVEEFDEDGELVVTAEIIASWVTVLRNDVQSNKINRNTEAALFYLLEYIFGHASTEITTPGTSDARLYGEAVSDNAECCMFIRANMPRTINRWLYEKRKR